MKCTCLYICVMYANIHGFIFTGLCTPAPVRSRHVKKIGCHRSAMYCTSTPGEMCRQSQHVTTRLSFRAQQSRQRFFTPFFFPFLTLHYNTKPTSLILLFGGQFFYGGVDSGCKYIQNTSMTKDVRNVPLV